MVLCVKQLIYIIGRQWMPKFTQEQLDQATAEFFSENVPPVLVPGAGNNGQIVIYKKEENGQDEG